MSHVDDGELTAYADGAYPVNDPEALRISAHLSACDNCRNRLEQSHELRTRVSEILAYAAPMARNAPPFETLEQQVTTLPAPRRRAIPLAWAATIVLALGLGWFGRGLQDPAVQDIVMQTEKAPQTTEAMPSAPADRLETDLAAGNAPAASQSRGATRPRPEIREERDMQEAGRVAGNVGGAGVAANAPPPTVGAAQSVSPAAPPAAAPAPQATLAAPTSQEAAERRSTLAARVGTQVMSAADAERRGLSVPRIPELPITRVLVSGENTTVEQRLADGKLVSLIVTTAAPQAEAQKSKSEAAADAASGSVRNVVVQSGSRRVIVTGDLPADSLRALGLKVR